MLSNLNRGVSVHFDNEEDQVFFACVVVLQPGAKRVEFLYDPPWSQGDRSFAEALFRLVTNGA
jgi:hypothetical protein